LNRHDAKSAKKDTRTIGNHNKGIQNPRKRWRKDWRLRFGFHYEFDFLGGLGVMAVNLRSL
jgi:hypothetical protein